MITLNEKTLIQIEPEFQNLALYNYAVFTSFLTQNGSAKKFEYHLERLNRDCSAIFGTHPSEELIRKNIRHFLTNFESLDSVIVRVTIFPKKFSLAHPGNIQGLNILVTGHSHGSVSGKVPLKLLVVDTQRTMWSQKTTNMIANLKARAIAQKQGYNDVVLSSDNLITEGATWNIFFLQKEKLITPPIQDGLLPGIIRKIVLENISQTSVELKEESVYVSSLENFDGCFITNAAIGIAVVGSINEFSYKTESEIIKQIKEVYTSIPFDNI
ncbi:aminotransferase class IV [Candidatus Parabeggiatoa sp. HSG14]|uniref:aminotransferase class IV n=1 Tax=Candidatus Parabeggiatoa sp. HSG14 TaxID=3055593 RepID=UPI0025A7244C|nr:aminotransferase class IV [Thiotrichales bacterium HSG14]